MNLIIVESPTKARTIQKFLDKTYSVVSSFGHIRDLPKKELGIDIANNFEPKYVVPLTARKKITPIKKSLEKASKVILATDEDREGEAIAWHLTEVLGLPNTANQLPQKKVVAGNRSRVSVERIAFHEITKSAIEEALKKPRSIDMDLVDAQQARRILDRLVGYELSPFLWRKVARGLSAGRVQSVAVRLIVEREREIQNFKPQEYWSIEALLRKFPISDFQFSNKSQIQNSPASPSEAGRAKSQTEFTAFLAKKDNKPITRLDIKTKEEADKIIKDLEGAQYQVANIEQKEIKRHPQPPFTTSTLQQEAWRKFKFSAKLTMGLAQNLYENGYITYHRTDSLNLSTQSLFAAKKFIIENYGQNYWAGYLSKFKTKAKGAQEAHEAIRPTNPEKNPEELIRMGAFAYPEAKGRWSRDSHADKFEENLAKLYDLIWRRFVASQMSQAIFDSTVIDIAAKNPAPYRSEGSGAGYTFQATGSIKKFDGFLKVYPISFKEIELPPLEINEILELLKLTPSQHFTQPPNRFSEATLIKTLEQNGIGRPSTYAPIISTILERNYVQKDQQKKFFPTDIGFTVNDLLVEHFPEIVDLRFTAHMEEDLDEIAQGEKRWQPVIKEFYEPFSEHLKLKYSEVEKQKPAEQPTDKTCPRCDSPLVIRTSRFGRFFACSSFPKCRYTQKIVNSIGVLCPQCLQGQIIEKRTKKGKIFYACSRWPDCDFALWYKPTGTSCPRCGSLLVETAKGKVKCSNKECGYREIPTP